MLCPSLSGIDVPYLIVTSRANEIDYQNIEKGEHCEDFLPISKKKKINNFNWKSTSWRNECILYDGRFY